MIESGQERRATGLKWAVFAENETIRNVVVRAVTRSGHMPISVADREAAIRVLAECPVHGVVLDADLLPALSGDERFRELKSRVCRWVVLGHNGSDPTRILERCVILPKPFALSDFMAALA